MVWDGIEQRDKDRRGCEWPACGAKNDADTKHAELRRDLGEIMQNQKDNNLEFRKLAETMIRVASLKEDFVRLELAHHVDIERLDSALENRPKYRELYTYAAIIAFAMGIVQFVILYFTR